MLGIMNDINETCPPPPESHDYVALSLRTAIKFLEPPYMTFVITSANIVLLNVIYQDGR